MVLSMDRWKGKTAIITGTSAGIGAAIAKALVQEGLQVVGLARRVERVEELAKQLEGAKGKLHPLKADVTKEEDILAAFDWTSKNLGPVHILINNAGIVQQTTLVEGETEKWKKVFDTNVLGLCVATREAVKVMKANKIDGHIIHINSIAGHSAINIPGVNVYPASKHAVTALTETLRQELNHLGLKIRITSVSPGGVSTEIAQTNNFKPDPAVMEMNRNVSPLESEDIADSVMYVLSTPPHVQVHELIIKPVGEKL
ncbi:hypothetical protein Zmor_005209 [Zophobas morio]|uniref:Dehydrogenase/reductase SDR family member 11 n=1 Tax=Zophobas morio TaxID=2755281 RepID=A0AA38IMV9_9CUCU|nr:hypothetical protein Zmor_005209 [Zophobas morio]